MATNFPSTIPIVQRPLTRIVPSGDISLAAGQSQQFSGGNARQNRIQFVITVMDALLYVDLQSFAGKNWGAAFAQRPLTLETSDDIQVTNNNGSTVIIRVAELYPDTGNRPAVAGGGGGGGAAGGGSNSSGGGGTSNSSGGSQLR